MARHTQSHRTLEDWTERDLTAAAARNDLPPAFAVDEQIDLALDILASGRSLVVVGESGVGRTALVWELVRRAAAGQGPPAFEGRRVLQFSFRHRVSALKDPKLLLPETQRLVDVLCQPQSAVVPFFRDLHLAYSFDLEPQLQSLVYRLGGPVLGEAEPATLSTLFEHWPELEQHFVTLTLEEPSLPRASTILREWAAHRRATTGQRYTEAALDEALHLSHRFLARSRFPRKALDLLVQSGSTVGKAVDRDAVVSRFASAHRVPRSLVDPVEPLDVAALERTLGRELLGQHEAVEALTRMIALIKSGLSDTRRPFGVFLFAGPTGVGKTHAAKLLAQHLFGSAERVVRLNMADHDSDASADVLFGNPAAYEQAMKRGVVTQRTAGKPFGLLLLDEFEKANEKVADRFLQLFDEGAFINGLGEMIACRSMIIIATSNVGAELYRQQPPGFFSPANAQQLTHELDRRLSQRFRFELLNRFDQIVHFNPLSRGDVRMIAARELQALAGRVGFKRTGMDLEVDESVLDWLAVNGYDPRFGARFLRRSLERHVTSALATLLVRGPAPSGAHARLTVRADRIEGLLVQPSAALARESITLREGAAPTRMLDREALRARAAEILAVYQTLVPALGEKQDRARALLHAMNQPGFWDQPVDSREVVDEYRRLDVALQIEARFVRPLQELEALLPDVSLDIARLVRAVEAAAQALREWQERLSDDGVRDVWLVIERADPSSAVEDWVLDVARMELAWCGRRNLEASVVACEFDDGDLLRVVVRVEGPAARASLAAEEGIHRRAQRTGADVRVRVAVVPRGAAATPVDVTVSKTKRRAGPLGLSITCAARVDSAGTTRELAGDDETTLREVTADLLAARGEPSATVLARSYGKDGVAARDSRTGVTALRMKDVLKGELESFLEGWRTRAVTAPSA